MVFPITYDIATYSYAHLIRAIMYQYVANHKRHKSFVTYRRIYRTWPIFRRYT